MNMLWKRTVPSLLALYLLLGSWKGYVALFEKDAEEPRQIFSCPVSALPEADIAALEEKIPIRNSQQLRQILEDYLS